jgi:protein arginine kinase
MEKNKAHAILGTKKPWIDNGNAIWLATTLKLYRNVEKFSFPGKLSADKRKQITSLISKKLLGMNELKTPTLIKAEDTQPLEKEYLLEHFLAMQGFHEAHSNEAFIIDETGEFLALINIREHVQLQITDCGGEIENSWNRLVNIETALGSSVNYAYSPQFGFLTADPHICGTGLLAHAFLHVPGLIHTGQLPATMQKSTGDQIATAGLQGDPLNLIGDVIAYTTTTR